VRRDAIADKERLLRDIRRIQGLLRAALDAVENAEGEDVEEPPAVDPVLPERPQFADEEEIGFRRLAG
jgi:hypothetical protein